jgi:hypothetical protein
VVLYSALAHDRLPEVVGGIGAGGLAVTAAAVAGRWPSLLPFGLAGVGASYTLFLSLRERTVDTRSPLVAAAFFAAAELAFWSLERREGSRRLSVLLRRLILLVLGAFGAALLGALLLVLSAGASGGVTLEAIGVVAAIATLAIVTRLAARSRDSTST